VVSVFDCTISSKCLSKRKRSEQIGITTLVDNKAVFMTKVEAEITIIV
jgi:hypothetical protein